MKYKKKYEVNISVILIVGVVFLIWGMSLLVDGVTIRKNLKNIYSGDVNVSKLKEGNYITVDKVKVLGKRENGMESYSVWEYVSIEPLEYRYYMVSVKLVKCDNIIKENLYKKAVQIGDDM